MKVYFADNEGDIFAVELAGRVDGFVVGQDTDFVVLNSEGYRGYLPLEEMFWVHEEVGVEALGGGGGDDNWGDEDGFQVVRRTKRKKPALVQVKNERKQTVVGRGIVPPNSETPNLLLQVTLYEPPVLAQHFGLPTSLLPLLGSLVGNDYTAPSHNALLFERRLTVSQRIAHAAMTLESILHPKMKPGGGKTQTQTPPQSVLQLIEMTVERLVNTSFAPANMTGSAARAEIVDEIVDATLPYAIRSFPTSEVQSLNHYTCPLHPPTDCTLFYTLSSLQDTTNEHHATLISAYLSAYRVGELSPKVMNVFSTGTFWPRMFLEDPDMESVARSLSRGVRVGVYAVLESALGIPGLGDAEGEGADADVDEGGEGEDPEDELIDVEEDDDDGSEDNVEQLRGALRDLSFDDDDDDGDVSDSEAQRSELDSGLSFAYSRRSCGPKVVLEYVRKGTRVVAEEVDVPTRVSGLIPSSTSPLGQENGDGDDVPLPLQPETTRFMSLLEFLRSDTQSVRNLPREQLMMVLTLRTVVRHLYERALEAPNSKERQRERWSRYEAQAFVASFLSPSDEESETTEDDEGEREENIPVRTRSVQLVAQICTTLESIHTLSQVLFLSDRVPYCGTRFSGKRFHEFLARGSKSVQDKVQECVVDESQSEVWRAVSEGLEKCFLEVGMRKGDRKNRRENGAVGEDVSADTTPKKGKAKAGMASKNIYALLGDSSL